MTLERKEFKEAPAKKAEPSIMQKIANDPENVMNSYGQRSMGIAINKLSERYFTGKTDEEIENLCNNTVKELQTLAESKIDAGLKAGIEHILTKIQDKPDLYDTVEIYLPVKGTEPLQYHYVNSYFALKQVLTLGWLAIHDDNQFAHHPVNPKQTAEDAKMERRERMLQSFQMLRAENPCHLGHRHQLIFPLNKSAIDVDVIPDSNTTILKFLTEESYPLFWKKWNDIRTTDATKKELQTALFTWMKDNNISKLIQRLDFDDTILISLMEFFIQHGSDPYQTRKEYQLAIQFANFAPDANVPTLTHLHALLTAEDIKNHATFNNAIRQTKEWIETQFDLNCKKHQEWIHQIHVLHEAQHLLHEYHLLLILTAKYDAFTPLKNFINTFFNAFNMKDLTPLSEEITASITALKKAVNDSKKSTLNDQVENFFANWYEAHSIHNTRVRRERVSLLYSTLLNHDFQTKVRLTDETIQRIADKAIAESKDGKLDIDPYVINRFFLHAILTNPRSTAWTPLFTHHLKVVLNFVENYFNEGNTGLAAKLKRDSYPETLLQQIGYAISVHEENPIERPVTFIQLLQQVQTPSDLADLTVWLDEPTLEMIYESLAPRIHYLATTQMSLSNFLVFPFAMPVSRWVAFYKCIGTSCFSDFANDSARTRLIDSLEKRPGPHINAFVNLLIDEYLRGRRLNIQWLTDLFHSFADDIHENTLQKMLDILITEKKLLFSLALLTSIKRSAVLKKMKNTDILKMLHAENDYRSVMSSLLTFRGEDLLLILDNATDELLLAWENKSQVTSQLIKHLPVNKNEAFIIRYCSLGVEIPLQQLTEMIGLLPPDRIDAFLTYLGEKRIQAIVERGDIHQLGDLLDRLPEANWQPFFTLLDRHYFNKKLISSASGMQLFCKIKNNETKLDMLITYIDNETFRQCAVDESSLDFLLRHVPYKSIKNFLKMTIGFDALKKMTFADDTYYVTNKKPHMLLARVITENPECKGDMLHAETITAEINDLLSGHQRIVQFGIYLKMPQDRLPILMLNETREQILMRADTDNSYFPDQIRKSLWHNDDELNKWIHLYVVHHCTGRTTVKPLMECKRSPEAPGFFSPARETQYATADCCPLSAPVSRASESASVYREGVLYVMDPFR